MVEAYILATVQPGHEREVTEKIKAIKGIEEVNELYGEWDIIIKAKVGSLEELNTALTDDIRSIKEIRLTSTMIVAKYKR